MHVMWFMYSYVYLLYRTLTKEKTNIGIAYCLIL